MVGHADLDDRTAALPELDEELGREERAAGFDTDPLERRSPEELARAVDVADAQVEEEPVREAVGARVERPEGRVRAPDPVADDDVRCVGAPEPLAESAEVRDPELAVAVRERDRVVSCGADPRAEGRAVPEVRGMVHGPDDVGIGRGEPVRDRRGRVARAVVDDDDLERRGERRQRLERLGDERLEVRLFVVRGEEVREAVQAIRQATCQAIRSIRRGALPLAHRPRPWSLNPSLPPAGRVLAPRLDTGRRRRGQR